jgi:hypothetical protein
MTDYRQSAAMTRGPTARLRPDGKPVWPIPVEDLPVTLGREALRRKEAA